MIILSSLDIYSYVYLHADVVIILLLTVTYNIIIMRYIRNNLTMHINVDGYYKEVSNVLQKKSKQ